MKPPLQEVKDRFGSKEKLVESLYPLLEKADDESKEEFRNRLLFMSNRKLLHLYAIEQTLRSEFGSRDKLIDAILSLAKQSKDKDYRDTLETFSSGMLLDLFRQRALRAKRGAKKRRRK
jgi:hypothetical protein